MKTEASTTASRTRTAVLIIAVIVVAAALNVAAVTILPVAASLIIAAGFWPLRQRLRRVLPASVAAAVCAAILLAAVAIVAGWGWYAATNAAEQFNESRGEYVTQYREAREWLTGLGVPPSSLPELNADADKGQIGEEDVRTGSEEASSGESTADAAVTKADEADQARPDAPETGRREAVIAGADNAMLLEPETRERLVSFVVGGLRSALGAVVAIIFTIVLVYFALAEGDRWDEFAQRQFSPRRYRFFADLVGRLSVQVRQFFMAKTITGMISGGATFLWLWIMGVPLAFTFGVFTLFMNYIPNIGALLSAVPAALLAIVELGWTRGLIVAAGLYVIETAVGNLIDPIVQGDLLKLSTYVVLISLIFWSWLWGVAGAFLGVVLTAAIVTTVQYVREHAKDGLGATPGHA